jgi:hypothetical protein
VSTILAFTSSGLDWGDVPTWIGAITTLCALLAAAYLVAIEVRRDRREADRQDRAEQADKVAAWFDDASGQLLLRNGSSLPIYNVLITIFPESPELATIQPEGAVPPGDTLLAYPPMVMNSFTETSLRLMFTDTAGRSWERSFNGRLRRLPNEYGRFKIVKRASRTDVVPPEGGEESAL